MARIESFTDHQGVTLQTTRIDSSEVFPGVVCDAYEHPETKKRDLAIINIKAGYRTRPQRVLSGIETTEGYISGKGRLIIIKEDGEKLPPFEVEPGSEGFAHTVKVGEIMQWQADEDLVVFEVCYLPYEDDRFENLEDEEL